MLLLLITIIICNFIRRIAVVMCNILHRVAVLVNLLRRLRLQRSILSQQTRRVGSLLHRVRTRMLNTRALTFTSQHAPFVVQVNVGATVLKLVRRANLSPVATPEPPDTFNQILLLPHLPLDWLATLHRRTRKWRDCRLLLLLLVCLLLLLLLRQYAHLLQVLQLLNLLQHHCLIRRQWPVGEHLLLVLFKLLLQLVLLSLLLLLLKLRLLLLLVLLRLLVQVLRLRHVQLLFHFAAYIPLSHNLCVAVTERLRAYFRFFGLRLAWLD